GTATSYRSRVHAFAGGRGAPFPARFSPAGGRGRERAAKDEKRILLVRTLQGDGTLSRPNILIFMTDQQRADTVPPYRRALTPNLDRFSREGVTFSQAYAPSPHCCPSDRKSTRLNSSHVKISYAVFCLNKKTPRGA